MRVLVIAEAGVNHDGSLERAIELVDVAADAGADVVKFQTFKASALVTRSAKKAEYQQATTPGEASQLAMLEKLELSAEAHRTIARRCSDRGVEFLSSPFDEASLDFLVADMGLKTLKFGSGEITNAPLLLRAARSGCDLILSTGMSTLADVERALAVLAFGFTRQEEPSRERFGSAFGSSEGQAALRRYVTLLQCTTEYPAAFGEVNLRAMETMRHAFGLRVGFSDHTPGIAMPTAAVALGATVIEKHFTTDKTLPGPDHRASLDPAELRAMIEAIRAVEVAMGDGVKRPAPSEQKNAAVARKSLTASRAVAAGETFSLDNLTVKRPGTGRSPFELWDVIGTPATKSYDADETIG